MNRWVAVGIAVVLAGGGGAESWAIDADGQGPDTIIIGSFNIYELGKGNHHQFRDLDDRENEVEFLEEWLRTFQPETGGQDVILVGDTNRYGNYTGTTTARAGSPPRRR